MTESNLSEAPLLDLSYLYELSENDNSYIHEVIRLYMESVPDGLNELEQLINETDDYVAIMKQAHFLKSSANIIKVRNMHADLSAIEIMARENHSKPLIKEKLDQVLINFRAAQPGITDEFNRTSLE